MLATASHTNFIVCLILLVVAKEKSQKKKKKILNIALSIIMAFHSFLACTLLSYIYIYSCWTEDNLLSCNNFSTLLWLTY